MALLKEAYQALQSIVGEEWVSDDPAIVEADHVGGGAHAVGNIKRPAASIQPETAEEVQGIIKACNKYMIPFSATTTNPPPGLDREGVLFIDLKRMRKMEIDEENLYATVEPGVSFAALQGELFKKGLVTFVPMCGGNVSVLANSLNVGEGAISYRYGDRGYRRVLAAEWVTAEGEMLRIGSSALQNDFFWGEGPGPDLRGLMASSNLESPTTRGICTKIGIRVFPFVNEKLEPTGDAPTTTLILPPNRFKYINFTFPNREAAIDALYEIGKCEIGLFAMTVPPWFFAMARVRGSAEVLTGAAGFWDYWNKHEAPLIQENRERTAGRVLLYGIGSDKRLAYEEKVLLDICEEYGATAKASRRATDETHFMSSDAIVSNIAGGRFTSVILFESLDHALKCADIVNENTKKHVPPVLDDYGTTNWFLPFEMCHICKLECLRFASVEDAGELALLMQDCHKDFVDIGAFPVRPEAKLYGPKWENYPEKTRKFKQLLDPNNLAPPLE
jgi:glycolate oxidase